MGNFIAHLEKRYPFVQWHEIGIRGVYVATDPNDKRVAIVTEHDGRIILSPNKAKAVCEALPEIIELFAKP